MEDRKIYFYLDNAETEYTAITSGFKPYVVVENNGKFYRVRIYTLKNLSDSYKLTLKQASTYYSMSSAIILVKRASKQDIVDTVLSLYNDFFDALRPLTPEELDDLLPMDKKPFSEWVQVYPEQSLE